MIDPARILRGWTRRDLGRKANVEEGTLCDLIAGRRRPTFGTLRAICHALGLPMEAMIRFTNPQDWTLADRTGTDEAHAV